MMANMNSVGPLTEIIVRIVNTGINDRTNGGPRLIHIGREFHGVCGDTDNMIQETVMNGTTVGIRTCFIYRPEIMFNSTNVMRYTEVSKLELCCPLSIAWVFDWTSRLPNLKLVRFGGGFFDETECYEPVVKKIENSPSVQTLILNFDKPKFDKKDKMEQECIQDKLEIILDLVATYFTKLAEVEFTMPDIPALDIFLEKMQHIKNTGTKRNYYIDHVVTFSNLRPQDQDSSFIKRPPPEPEPEVQAPNKRIKRESEALPKSPVPQIPVVDLELEEVPVREIAIPGFDGYTPDGNQRNGRSMFFLK